MVQYSFRPSAADRTGFPVKGRLYHFTFSLTAENHRSLDYQKILEYSQPYHTIVAYIVLDSFQRTLQVSIPALHPARQIVEAAEHFYDACCNLFTFSYHDHIEKRMKAVAEDSTMADYELFDRPFEAIASQWPHYVIPPGHPFEVLGPDCPCSFFEA